MNAIEYANRASRLFAIPKTAIKIKRLSDSGSADIKEIAQVVASDPGLAAHVLKLANSAVYRFSRKVEELEKALQIIGLNSVYEFALAFAVSDALSKEHEKYINIEKYWQQSVSCALMARSVSKLIGEKDVSRMFMSGLFHNVGELAVLRINPTLARDCNRFDKELMPKQVQQQLLGFSFAEISAALLQKWLLPDSVVSTVAMQHHDELPALTTEVQIMQLAYASSLSITYPEFYEDSAVHEQLLAPLNIDFTDFVVCLEETKTNTLSTVDLFTG